MKEILILVAGGLVGIVGTYLTARQKFKDDLQAKYDETLHNTRIGTYQDLWGRLEVLSRYARPEPVTPNRLCKLVGDLRAWYFEVAGLFLSDASENQYFDLQTAIAGELDANKAGDLVLDEDHFDRIHKLGRAAQTLADDLRSRSAPRV